MAGNKRKRASNKAGGLSPEDQYNIERADRYKSLVKFCQKAIRKEGKIVRTFEVQKMVKRLKLLEKANADAESYRLSDDASDEGTTVPQSDACDKMKKAQEKRRRQIDKLEKRLKLTKTYDIERLVELCSKRIGLGNLAPPEEQEKEEKEDVKDDSSNVNDPERAQDGKSEDEESLSQLAEDMLRHKRLIDVIDKLNERITDHRRWVLRREEHIFGGDFPGADDIIPGKRRKGKGAKTEGGNARTDHAGPAALFIGSLSGGGMNEDVDGAEDNIEGYGDYYGQGGHEDEYGIPQKKKNRPGQRQRKAKAMAIEAKKAGRTWNASANWREKKTSTNDESGGRSRRRDGKAGGQGNPAAEPKVSASGLKSGDNVGASDVANMGKDWKEEGKAHPSWAAQQAQKAKSGIQQFAGKKITFD